MGGAATYPLVFVYLKEKEEGEGDEEGVEEEEGVEDEEEEEDKSSSV